MNRRILVTGLFAPTLVAAAAFVYYRAPMEARAQDAEQLKRASKAMRDPVLQGTQSCATSVCHGGGDLGQPLSEFTTWRALDPHARSYETLLNEKSSSIAKNLWADQAVAHEAPLCLKCHVDPNYERARPRFRRQDGVGCESCHGAAQGWLHDHYREAWQNALPNEKIDRGMRDTKNLPGRARACVDCHVGVPGNEVDHDLIAAGHPALRFEFATYFANLPPHWNVEKDQAKPDFEARAWVAGQLVTASRALELLAHRADPATGRPWPEFAEFDCFACHHDLQASSWRQKVAPPAQRRPGTLRRGDWYTAMLPGILSSAKAENAAKLLDEIREGLEPSQEKTPGPFSDAGRKQITAASYRLAKSLSELADKPADAAWLDRLPLTPRPDRNWDEATQRYLALLSLQQMRKDNKQSADGALDGMIRALRKDVTFALDRDSPQRFVPQYH